MDAKLNGRAAAGLERSCGPLGGDWIRWAPPSPGIDRIEAFFSGHAYDPHRHDTYAIGVTMAGVQRFDYRGQCADSTPGKVIVIHPDERHNGRAGAETGFRYRMLYIEPSLIAAALSSRATGLPFAPAPVFDDSRLRRALALAFEDAARPLEELLADQLTLALAESLAFWDSSARPQARGTSPIRAIDRARQFLAAHCEKIITSDALEAETGIDRYSLARHFRARFGTSPYRYLTMRRLDRARILILAGDSLADAAAASGFADQSHLTRKFKLAFGMTPGRWRQLQAAG